MTTAGKAIQTATPQTSHGRNSDLDRVSELMRTLVPIRPVGMTDEAASDWAAVIYADTLELSDAVFLEGCAKARRECSDHRHILRTIHSASTEAQKPDPMAWAMVCHQKPPRQIEATPVQKLISQAVEGLRT